MASLKAAVHGWAKPSIGFKVLSGMGAGPWLYLRTPTCMREAVLQVTCLLRCSSDPKFSSKALEPGFLLDTFLDQVWFHWMRRLPPQLTALVGHWLCSSKSMRNGWKLRPKLGAHSRLMLLL